jgi:hypothetical protein
MPSQHTPTVYCTYKKGIKRFEGTDLDGRVGYKGKGWFEGGWK